VLIVVHLNDYVMFSGNNGAGHSASTGIKMRYEESSNQKTYAPIHINLYFNEGLETFANEIGDIEFTLDKINSLAEYKEWRNNDIPYHKKKETTYSYGIEKEVGGRYNDYKKDNNVKNDDLDKRGSIKTPEAK
jgi:hypothetical protein